jgi:hypothetical protein
MRPRGEVREAIARATDALATHQGMPPTWRDLLSHVPGINPASPGEQRLVRKTVENMALAGELERAGKVRVQGVSRPMTTYRPRKAAGWARQGVSSLDNVMRDWRVT